MNNVVMNYMQRIGKSLMMPVAVLPMCAILMGVGYILCPESMQGAEISGVAAKTGYFLVTAGGAMINNISVLFAIGVAFGMSKDNHGAAAMAGMVAWLVISALLNTDTISYLYPAFIDNDISLLAFQKINNPFIGILAGIIGSECYNRNNDMKLPDSLAFFSGRRFVAIVTVCVSIITSVILLFCWPLMFRALVFVGKGIVSFSGIGVGIYAFCNRLLIPSGLHHALNNVFWFDTIGIGDLTKYWAGQTSADVTWSLGMYMSGFFPCFMFGVPGAALAMYHTAKNRKKVKGILLSSSVSAFLCGITEPFEFAFMFTEFPLYVVYAGLCAIVSFVTYLTGFRAGFAFSAGIIDLIFSASLPAAERTWMILPLGAFAFLLYYVTFRVIIVKFDLKTPGREEAESLEDSDDTAAQTEIPGAAGIPTGISAGVGNRKSGYSDIARAAITSAGGPENILNLDCCATRLRLELKDSSLIDEAVAKAAGIVGVRKIGKTSAQFIIGPSVQQVCDEAQNMLKNIQCFEADFAGCISVTHGQIISLAGNEEKFEYQIRDLSGIHARPAGSIVKIAKKYDAEITASANGRSADVRSLTELLALGATKRSVITVSAHGPDRYVAIRELKEYIERNL